MEHVIDTAIKCGPKPVIRDWRNLPLNELTTAEQVMSFAEMYLKIPSGEHVTKPLKLALFQEAFIYSVFDNPAGTRTAILSVARRNSKTFITAVILLAYLVGPLAEKNVTIASAANSRDQAGLIAKFMFDMIAQSPEIDPLIRIVQSKKLCKHYKTNSQYISMSADARTGYGQSLKVVVLDESGQIKGPDSDYVSMLRTSQGSYENPLFITISTQAATDADWLSIVIDDAIREQDPHTVVHLYTTPEDFGLLDEEGWKYSNPALDIFRSRKDLEEQLKQATRITSQSALAQNLLLNRRIAQDKLWIAPDVWKDNSAEPKLEVFQSGIVAAGLDLSTRTDLTACVLAAKDSLNEVHLLPFIFTPKATLEARAAKDRAPYPTWVEEEKLIAVPGSVLSYDWIAHYMARKLKELDIKLDILAFDRWRIEDFKLAAQAREFGLEATWQPVGQGYASMSPRLDAFETLLLEQRIRHGSHPLLNFGAAGCIVQMDPARNRKLEKAKSTSRIDAIVAAVMAAYAITEGEKTLDTLFDVEAVIG